MLGDFLNRCINKGGHGLRLDPLDWKNLWKSWERSAVGAIVEGKSFTLPEASRSQKELCDQPCQSHS